MTYINCGAHVGDSRPASKKALRDAIASGAELVMFDSTSMFDGAQQIVLPGAASAEVLSFTGTSVLQTGQKLSVVGPDPYTSRKWYATVELVNGKVKVS